MEFELAEVRNQLEPFGVFAPLGVLGWILFLLENSVKLDAVSPQHSDVVLLFQVPTFPVFSWAEVPTFPVSSPNCSPATIPGWVSWFHGHFIFILFSSVLGSVHKSLPKAHGSNKAS